MVRWEHKLVALPNTTEVTAIEEYLNRLGSDGWELVQATINSGADFILLIFKRPVPIEVFVEEKEN